MRWRSEEKGDEQEIDGRRRGPGKAVFATVIACLLVVGAFSASFLISAGGGNATNSGMATDISLGNGTSGNDSQTFPATCSASPHPGPPPELDENGTSPGPWPPHANESDQKPAMSSHIVVEPRLVWLDVNVTQQFTAQAYDPDGQSISGLNYSWELVTLPVHRPQTNNSELPTAIGTVDENGLFTATADGFGCVIVTSEFNGEKVSGYAFVQIGNPPPPNPGGCEPGPGWATPPGGNDSPPRRLPGGEGHRPPPPSGQGPGCQDPAARP